MPDAVSASCRSIDTAQSHGNEEALGSAVEKCGVPRQQLFLTTKIWILNTGYEKAKVSIERSLKKLKTDYMDLCQFAEVMPAVNQVETHVFHQQKMAHEYTKKYGVQHESWEPFAEGQKDFFSNPVLTEIGAKYGKSSAQTALRFLLQSNVVVIPKSTHNERMEQNLDAFDFSLEEEDMEAIRAPDEGESLFFNHYAPATVEMLANMGKTTKV